MINNEILKWVEPKIELDQMNAFNFPKIGDNESTIDNIGDNPWITIRSYSLNSNLISSLIIDCSDFYPFIYLTFDDSNNAFKSLDFPLNQDVISIFIKPKSEIHKAIRCDFHILQISGTNNISIKGILKIPSAFDTKIFGLKSSSIESVFKASRNLNLGFASNFENSNDIQNWVSFNETFLEFIQKIQKNCFINKESWINCFVDLFYCMNWLNAELIYSLDDSLDKSIITMFSSLINTDLIKNNEKIQTFLLTNHPNFLESNFGVTIEPNFSETSNFQNGHTLNSVSIDLSKGEIKTENVFVNESNHDLWKKQNGRDKKDILIEKTKWNGIQSSNVHENWNTAKAQNAINNVNFSGIKITGNGLLTEIMKGRRIPIFIVDLNSSETLLSEKNIENSINDKPKLNEFWSGFYIVDSLRYEWNLNGWKTNAIMKRKQWNSKSRKNHFGAF